MKIQELLQKNRILIDIPASDKQQLLEQMGRFLAASYNLGNADFIVQRILEREADMSTGVGYGIAIPHCRLEGIAHAHMIAGRPAAAVDFDAIDDVPVNLVFMMVSPANTATEHSQILSRLSKIMAVAETRDALVAAQDAEHFMQVLIDGENGLD